jgi:hypothetical protein
VSAEPPAVSPSPIRRLVRLLRPGGNPLARGVDRTEGAVVGLVVLVALALVPVMLTLGSVTYAGLAERSARQAESRHETVAILTENAPVATPSPHGTVINARSPVPARWQLLDGSTRTGPVSAEDGLKAGAEVPVWLDRSGNAVDPPLSSSDAVVTGVLVAVCGWLAVAALFSLVCWGLHRAFDRRRYRFWDTEWARVGPEWHDRHR